MDIHITIYQLLCLIGIPSIITGVNAWIFKKSKDKHDKHVSLELGVQALLRAEMINTYNTWYKKGYAPIYIRENFENCWKQYHGLGANGVMDDIHNKFIELPTDPPEEK